MTAIFRDLGLWFWRLVPANPILVRVVYAGGRRPLHFWIRLGYLVTIAAIVVIGVLALQSGVRSLTELAKNASRVFEIVAQAQVLFVCILAPVFAAGAITQEKDSRTFSILLSTPLSNGQIVLGSLLSRLYFVFVLLLAGIPLFCTMMVYGGVTGAEIGWSIAIAAATALLTGTVAITISVIRIGTGRTIFTFYLGIALYLIAVYALGQWARLIPPESPAAPVTGERLSWFAGFHPFLALAAVLGKTPPPDVGSVTHYAWPARMLLAYPQHAFIVLTSGASGVLVVLSLFFVRRGVREGESSLWSRFLERLHRSSGDEKEERGRSPRRVWHNPVSWRESVTGSAAGGGRLARYAALLLGGAVAITLVILHRTGGLSVDELRAWVFGVCAVELALALFLVTATAATSMTREKESNTLELLLTTPLTSRHIIQGKILGLIFAAGPMFLVPWLTVALIVVTDLFSAGPGVVNPESLLLLPILLFTFAAAACMIGLQASIKSKKTLAAVFSSMGVVILFVVLTSSCVFAIRGSDAPTLAAGTWPLTPLTALWVILDPRGALFDAGVQPTADQLRQCRVACFVSALCSAAIYGLVGWGILRSTVRNFDMVIRKQSA